MIQGSELAASLCDESSWRLEEDTEPYAPHFLSCCLNIQLRIMSKLVSVIYSQGKYVKVKGELEKDWRILGSRERLLGLKHYHILLRMSRSSLALIRMLHLGRKVREARFGWVYGTVRK
jgi:hypothetical protein